MRFEEPALERDYAATELARYASRQTTVGFVTTAGLWIVVAGWEIVVVRSGSRVLPLLFLANASILLGCAGLVALRGKRLSPVVLRGIAVFSSTVGVSFAVAQALEPTAFASYSGAMMAMFIIAVHSYMALRFATATFISLGLVIAHVVVMLAIAPIPTRALFGNVVFLLSGQLIGMQISYRTERYRRRDFRQSRLLRTEQERSEKLLHNMLPQPIAERLKREPGAIAESLESVTVLFADLVGFTGLSERLPASDLVALLNRVFSSFDDLAEHHGVEKIKTIGDAYMAVGGLSGGRHDHARAVVELALDMRDTIASLEPDTALRMRIGIHTGPAVAGVIGKTKYVYDLWGDTVNTASRMESHGRAGAIHISDATRRAIGDGFVIEARGSVDLKGKGRTETFWLEGRAGNVTPE